MRFTFVRTILAILVISSGGFVPSAATAAPHDYRLRPGDLIDVTVFGEPTLSQTQLRVLPGGTIVEPLVGSVSVGGLTTSQAGAVIGRKLTHYLRHPQVTVAVAQIGPVDVYVLGNVKTPGKYTLEPESRLMDALAAAGGLGPTNGDLPDARVSIDGDVTNVSLEKLLHQGDLSLNERVQNDMAVYVVSPNTFNVQVFGAVDKPGDVTMHEGDRLLQAIARAGEGANTNADLNRVVVRRTGTGRTGDEPDDQPVCDLRQERRPVQRYRAAERRHGLRPARGRPARYRLAAERSALHAVADLADSANDAQST